MPRDTGPIFGRDTAVDLVRAFMERSVRDGMPQSQDQPVLVFEGAHGSGKTTLINWLAELSDQEVPYARIDFEANRQASVPEVLSGLAFELSRRCDDYIQLRFPRLSTGLLVMRQDLALEDHASACRQVTVVLEEQRSIDRLRQLLASAAGDLSSVVAQTTGVPVGKLGEKLPGLALKGLVKWRRTRRVVLGSFYDWYGHRGRGLTNDGLDVLVDLNRWSRNVRNAQPGEAEDDQQRIDELLWEAFLVDLREEFAGARRADELSMNCVVLLDNVDTTLGQQFLRELVSARRQRAVTRGLAPEPLTVVATSRGALLANVAPAELLESTGSIGPTGTIEDATAPRALGQGHGNRHGWCRYRLEDLSKDEVGLMVSWLTLRRGNNSRLTAMTCQLSGGHPMAARLLLDAVAERPDRCDELSAVLEQPEPGGNANRPPVAAGMLQRLLGDFPRESTADLVTCSTARTRDHAVRLATSDDHLPDGTSLLVGSEANYLAIVDPMLWPASNGAGPVLLRRLLLRDLARRSTSGGLPEWAELFGWHRDRCAEEGDQVSELYYALAVGDLTFVAPLLLTRLTREPAAEWHAMLRAVTAAPHWPHHKSAPDAPIDAPIDEVYALIGDATGLERSLAAMTRLTAALQVVTSPFTGSRRRSVHQQINADYTDLARLSPSGRELLFAAAREHQRQAEWWN